MNDNLQEDLVISKIAGELVTETFEYDGGRQVTVYVPPDPPEAVVFAGDGQLISQWGGYLEAANVPPTMIVGVHRTADEDEMVRIHEYSPAFDAGTVRGTREVLRRGRPPMGAVALRCRAARRAHCGVRRVGEWRALARHGASASGHLRRGLLRLAGRGLPTACRDAEPASAHLPRRRHAGAVLPRERDPVGGRAARCRCGRRDDASGSGRTATRSGRESSR